MTDSLSEIQSKISSKRLSARQRFIIFICFFVNLVDGFDSLAIALTAPQIAENWNIEPSILGYILSAELLGMAIGAVLLSGQSDKIGRRPILLLSVFLVTISTFATAWTSTPLQLISTRIATGFGIGGVITVAATLASEFTPKRLRYAVVTLVIMGFSAGALVAGLTGAQILAQYDWQSLFLVGASLGTVGLVLSFFFVPESMEFRATQKDNPDKHFQKINRTLKALKIDPLKTFIPSTNAVKTSFIGSVKQLFTPVFRSKTLILWASFFTMFWANYSVGKWFTKLLVNDGFELSSAIYAITLWVVGGVLGSLIISFMSTRLSVSIAIRAMLVLSGAAVLVFGLIGPADVRTLYPLSLLFGFGIGGGLTALYSLPVAIYPIQMRALGLGLCVGVGRLGAIISPVITGYLVAAGWETTHILLGVLLPSLIIAFLLISLIKVPNMNNAAPD